MKKFNISLAVVAVLALSSSVNAQSLSEALSGGKVSGEVAATTEHRNIDTKGAVSSYYKDSTYGVGSFALKYETGVWNDLSMTSKVRAYGDIFEKEDDDARSRFYEKNGSTRSIDIEELFLTYAPTSNITVNAGRQAISTDWINKTHDAVKVDANFGNTSVEGIWSLRDGRVYSRDYRPLEKMNDKDGVFKLGVTQKFTDTVSGTAYGLIMPDVKEIYGAKANLTFGDTSVRAHYAMSEEDATLRKDSSIIDLMVSTSIAGFSPYAGYVKVDDDAAFPGYANTDSADSGEIIVPFEEGDYFYSKGAETFYLGLSKSFADLSATLLYGTTQYDNANFKDLRVHETTLWLAYPIMKDLKANLGYTLVDEDKNSSVSDYDQANFTLAYSF